MLCINNIYSGSVRKDGKKERLAECICECGNTTTLPLSTIKPEGRTSSCGCIQRKTTAIRNTKLKTLIPGTRKRDDRRYKMYHNAQHRAKKKGIPFTISMEDIVIPETCPLLGIPLVSTNNKRDPRNPSLDQKVPGEGYTPDNIWVVSSRANWIKSDATLQELKTLVENLEAL